MLKSTDRRAPEYRQGASPDHESKIAQDNSKHDLSTGESSSVEL